MALLNQPKATLFNWAGTALLSLITFLALNIYNDVKELRNIVPVLQEQIKSLQDDNSRLKNKIFAQNYYSAFAKKEDEITLQSLLKKYK